jgi:thioredoxin-dependent peroxiredoxin
MSKPEALNELKEGDKAPNFTFSDESGASNKLWDLVKKKMAVVYFYPRDFTPGCTEEAHEFTADYQTFLRNGIEIIGVSPDDEVSHKRFREKMKIPYCLASDPSNTVAKSYGVYGPKKFMGKEYVGIHRTTFLVNRDGYIIKVFKKVKPSEHSEEVLGAFDIG